MTKLEQRIENIIAERIDLGSTPVAIAQAIVSALSATDGGRCRKSGRSEPCRDWLDFACKCFPDGPPRPTTEPSAPVAVKELEWSPFRAFTPCGEYWVSEQPMMNGRFGAFIEGRVIGLEYTDVTEAKAAAQSDYEQCIRSALAIPAERPAGGGVERAIDAYHGDRTFGPVELETERMKMRRVLAALRNDGGE